MTLSYHFRLCIFLFRNSYIQTATVRVRSERLSLPVCRRPGNAHGRTPGALPRFLASPDYPRQSALLRFRQHTPIRQVALCLSALPAMQTHGKNPHIYCCPPPMLPVSSKQDVFLLGIRPVCCHCFFFFPLDSASDFRIAFFPCPDLLFRTLCAIMLLLAAPCTLRCADLLCLLYHLFPPYASAILP